MNFYLKSLAIAASIVGFGCLVSLPIMARQSKEHSGGVGERALFIEQSSTPRNFYKPAFSANEVAPLASPQQVEAADGVTFWANILWARSWGEDEEICGISSYTFKDGALTTESLVNNANIFANGSGAYYNGKFHMVSKSLMGQLYCEFDMKTWALLTSEMSVSTLGYSIFVPPIAIMILGQV